MAITVYAYSESTGTEYVLAIMKNHADWLDGSNREKMRKVFHSMAFMALRRGPIGSIRFSDECTACQKVKVGNSCENRACNVSTPPVPALAKLMKKHPADKDEAAGAYMDRLAALWRK